MRKSLLAGVAFFLVLFGILLTLLLPRPSRVTRENYERIREGMSRAQVEAIVGKPGDYRTRPTTIPLGRGSAIDDWKAWYGNEGQIVVEFVDGQVFGKEYVKTDAVETTPLGRLLWRLERWLTDDERLPVDGRGYPEPIPE